MNKVGRRQYRRALSCRENWVSPEKGLNLGVVWPYLYEMQGHASKWFLLSSGNSLVMPANSCFFLTNLTRVLFLLQNQNHTLMLFFFFLRLCMCELSYLIWFTAWSPKTSRVLAALHLSQEQAVVVPEYLKLMLWCSLAIWNHGLKVMFP